MQRNPLEIGSGPTRWVPSHSVRNTDIVNMEEVFHLVAEEGNDVDTLVLEGWLASLPKAQKAI